MNVADIKRNNRKKIYYYLREKGYATKQQISVDLKLSLPTVSRNLEYLEELQLINSEDKISNRTGGGRKPIAYTYVAEARASIGIDITKYFIKCLIVDLDGNVIYNIAEKVRFDRSDAYLKTLGNIVDKAVQDSGFDADAILGVGIAVPGLVDSDNQNVIYGKVIANEGMTIFDFAKYINFPAKLIHDTYAAGFNEVWMSPELQNAFYVSLGYSVGGSVLLNQELYVGEGIYSGEIGHMNLVMDGKECYCGQKGCYDAYSNADVLAKYTNGDLDKFFELLSAGDEKLEIIWDEYLENLSIIINDLRMLFGGTIIVGGLVGGQIGHYMSELHAKIDSRNPFGEKAENFVVPCKPHISAVAGGAALFFIDDFLRKPMVIDI